MADLGSRTLAAVLLHSMSERVCWPDLRLAAADMALRVAPAARTPATPPSMPSMHMHIKILGVQQEQAELADGHEGAEAARRLLGAGRHAHERLGWHSRRLDQARLIKQGGDPDSRFS